jgi:hypothetical protein
MQTATSFADPAIGGSFIPLDVSELELVRIDADARARTEHVRESYECVHESRAAQ